MSENKIVVKKIKKGGHGGHHGGAWKIAYADFTTAMMAFFLLMWLVGSVSKYDLVGIQEYFRMPLKVALLGGEGSGNSNSMINGGGKDVTSTEGQVKQGEVIEERKITTKASEAEIKAIELALERRKLAELKTQIESAINSISQLQQFKNQIMLDITSEGLRIQIVDEQNRPMFKSGSAALQPYSIPVLHELGKILNDVPNKIGISGHTDAANYVGPKGTGNWELSAERANSSRRELITGGMNPEKVARVVGLASSVLVDPKDPFNPVNRRISIIVMNRQAEENAAHDGGVIELGGDPYAQSATIEDDPYAHPGASLPE